jgi:hypothetical protein
MKIGPAGVAPFRMERQTDRSEHAVRSWLTKASKNVLFFFFLSFVTFLLSVLFFSSGIIVNQHGRFVNGCQTKIS